MWIYADNSELIDNITIKWEDLLKDKIFINSDIQIDGEKPVKNWFSVTC